MKLDITRQQPFPSLVTIFVTSIIGMFVLIGGHHLLFEFPSVDSLLGDYILSFQQSHRVSSSILTTCIILCSSLILSRVASMHNLFSDSTSIHIPILGVMLWCVVLNDEYLISVLTLQLIIWVVQSMFFAMRNNSSVVHLFNASLALGLLPLLYPSGAALWVALPIILMLSSGTWRESLSIVAGLILSLGGVSYIYWLCGYNILYVSQTIIDTIVDSTFPLLSFHTILLYRVVIFLVISILALVSPLWFGFSLPRSRGRLQGLYTLLVVSLLTYLLPSSTMLTFVILAPIVALLATFTMVRLRGSVVSVIYLILLFMLLFSMFAPQYIPIEQLIKMLP